jgi:hypothetical protein
MSTADSKEYKLWILYGAIMLVIIAIIAVAAIFTKV